MDKFVDTSEALVRIVGKGVAWLVLVSAFVISYDVVNRYILGRATDWGYDVAWMLYATSFIFGAAYTLQEGSHVRVDPIYQKIPEKARAYVDIVISVVFILPTVLTLTYFGVIYAYESWEVWERSAYSAWRPYIYPMKTMIPLAFILIGLQSVCDIIKSIKKIVGSAQNG